jgi:hypothetical protein
MPTLLLQVFTVIIWCLRVFHRVMDSLYYQSEFSQKVSHSSADMPGAFSGHVRSCMKIKIEILTAFSRR